MTCLCVCVSDCRCVRGSAQRCKGAPLVSSRAVPSLLLMEGWRMEVGGRRPRTLKRAIATFPFARFPPPLPPPLPLLPHLLMAAVGWVFTPICPTVLTRPRPAHITMTTARQEVLKLLITWVSIICLPPSFLRSEECFYLMFSYGLVQTKTLESFELLSDGF